MESGVGRELKKILKIADWIGGKRDADGIISPIPVQIWKVWSYQVPESGMVVLIDQVQEQGHAHQSCMGAGPRAAKMFQGKIEW